MFCSLCVYSSFANPRCSLQRETFYSFRLYEKNGEYPRGSQTSGLRGRFKAQSEKILTEVSSGTCRNRFFAQDGGEKALNRCDVPALQRKDLERTTKEWPCSLRTVGYGWVRMGDGGQKRVAWDNKERPVWAEHFRLVAKSGCPKHLHLPN